MNRSRTKVNKLNNKQPMGGGDGGSVLDRVGPRPFVAVASAMIVTAVKDMRELRLLRTEGTGIRETASTPRFGW